MATQVYTDIYPQWLIRKTSKRRLARFRVAYDASKVAGYSVKNPLTGTNYAYMMRVDSLDPDDWKEKDDFLKWSFRKGLLYTGFGFAVAGYISKPTWWYPVMLLLVGVGTTEIKAWYDESFFTQFKTEGEYQAAVQNDYNSDPAFRNMVDEAYRGDPEYYASKTWFMSTQDHISRFQGISILMNVVAGFCMERTAFGFGGVRGQYWNLNNLETWLVMLGWGPAVISDLNCWWDVGSKKDSSLSGAGISQWGHLLGLGVGVATGWFLK
jgi:hypothetical protein